MAVHYWSVVYLFLLQLRDFPTFIIILHVETGHPGLEALYPWHSGSRVGGAGLHPTPAFALINDNFLQKSFNAGIITDRQH